MPDTSTNRVMPAAIASRATVSAPRTCTVSKRRLLIPVPFALAEIQARLFEFLPNPQLTTGQVDLLKADNLASGTLPGLQQLKI